jgi:MFS transporter, AAHS family, 4-hydroxybenzoate transporter
MKSNEDTAGIAARTGSIPDAQRVPALAICFFVLLLDGLDTTSIGFVAPVLANEWSIPVSAFTPVFVATSLGAVVGYVICGPMTRSFGPRAIGGASVALFALGTLAMAAAWDIASLSALRFVSAIGLGGTVPITIVAATEIVTERRKETATMLVASGLSAGAVTGGLVGGLLLRAYGWEAVFVLGGILPLLVLPIFVRVLQPVASPGEIPSNDGSKSNLFAQLFVGGLAGQTVLLWAFAFLIFVVTHALIFWTPTLLLELGFERSQAPLGTAAFGMGGLIGNVAMVFLVAAIGIRRVLVITTLLAMACVIAISRTDIPASIVLLMIAGLGAGTITGCIGEAVLAVSIYPRKLRATGVGCATAMGRIGSILGPAAGGLLLSFGWPAADVLMTALIPAALALLVLAWLSFMHRRLAA